MAQKKTTMYKCGECGYTRPTWLGRCPECGTWNSLEECFIDPNSVSHSFDGGASKKNTPVLLSQVNPLENSRLNTGIDEFDRVLGGGAMKKSVILIGGEPGIGKSTLLLQTAASIAKNTAEKVLYVSGEESAGQIKGRADRLNLDSTGISLLCSMRLEDIKETLVSLNPVFAVIDSIQTVYSLEAGVIPGTINQLKFCANELIGWAKERDCVLVMSAHVTKDGNIAGPKSLEHMVDTVVSFERNDDDIRFLRAGKNRFGSVDELGLFLMTEKGLEGIGDPSAMFLTKREGRPPAGVANTAVFEGSRIFIVEIQALTVPAKSSISRVYSDKIDSARVARVAAVLEKKTGLTFSNQDIYINVAGGVKLSESAIDAALAASLYSARTGIELEENSVLTGELSLAGEIRPVQRLKLRVKTAKELGFKKVYAPESEEGAFRIRTVQELVKIIAEKGRKTETNP